MRRSGRSMNRKDRDRGVEMRWQNGRISPYTEILRGPERKGKPENEILKL